MARYSPAQVDLYFHHIEFPTRSQELNSSFWLSLLQRYHLARVPFDSIALHYSPTRLLSLHPEDLFQKIVVNSRGGYCMEVNAFFGNILRSLGYEVISVGGRVKHKKWQVCAAKILSKHSYVSLVMVDNRWI